jgi:hypothetical protein
MFDRKIIASKIYSRYSVFVDQINANGAVAQWIAKNQHAAPIFKTRLELYKYINDEICGSLPIDYLEFGVHEGVSLRDWIGINTAPSSRFFGFDSFEGLPEKWNKLNPAGKFDRGGQMPVIDDQRVRFIKGWFQHTLRETMVDIELNNRLIIHNDSDLHSSTLFVLTAMDKFITPGTIIIFDEFTSPLHEFRAFHEYLSAYMRKVDLLCTTENYASQAAFIFR